MRVELEDFVVEEVPLYTPSGEGEHLYLFVEKQGRSTPALIKELRALFGLKEVEIGIAGRKDERGVTRQWLSVPARVVEERVHEVDDIDGVRLLKSARHGNKLRLGHLRGNRFEIVLRGDVDAAEVESRASQLEAGFPNGFGAQRFGPDDVTLEQAARWLQRRRPSRTRREGFWVSAIQSSLFNACLTQRLADGLWTKLLDGDVLQKGEGGRGPLFICDEPEVDEARLRSGEVTHTGPMWGSKMRRADRDALTFESRSLKAEGVDEQTLCAHPAFKVGTRRPLRVVAGDPLVEPWTGGVRVSFTLPAGSYATVFIAELTGTTVVDEAFGDASKTAGA